MKLAPLLAHYLYTNKRLDLPGIGRFIFDPSLNIEQENNKAGKQYDIQGITFENNSSVSETTDLVSFISIEAGKMKALAAADLDSHLQQAKQFLNIGKPFLFEGIGSLVKLQSGQYEFSPGKAITEKMMDHPAKDHPAAEHTEESTSGFDKLLYHGHKKRSVKKPVVIAFIIGGLAIAIAVGYLLNKNKSASINTASVAEKTVEKNVPEKIEEQVIQKDSLPVSSTTSANVPVNNVATRPDNFKFVVEVANKERALQRFGTLKGWGLNIQMETKDSASYSLYFVLPASVSDTARISDSIGVLYSPLGKKAFAVN